PAYRDVGEHRPHPEALLVHDHEGAIHHIDLTFLDEDDRQALLDRDWFEGWQHAQPCPGAIDSIPRPIALAWPMPFTRACPSCAGSSARSRPSNCTTCNVMR